MKSFLLVLSCLAIAECFVVKPTIPNKILKGKKSLYLLPLDQLTSSTTIITDFMEQTSTLLISAAADMTILTPPETDGISYSKASYYTVLGLYLMSFPGLWSIIKRSTSAKVKRKTYITPGEKSIEEITKAKGLRQQAGEIMACKLIIII